MRSHLGLPYRHHLLLTDRSLTRGMPPHRGSANGQLHRLEDVIEALTGFTATLTIRVTYKDRLNPLSALLRCLPCGMHGTSLAFAWCPASPSHAVYAVQHQRMRGTPCDSGRCALVAASSCSWKLGPPMGPPGGRADDSSPGGTPSVCSRLAASGLLSPDSPSFMASSGLRPADSAALFSAPMSVDMPSCGGH